MFLVLSPIAVALAAILFVLIVWKTRYVSSGINGCSHGDTDFCFDSKRTHSAG